MEKERTNGKEIALRSIRLVAGELITILVYILELCIDHDSFYEIMLDLLVAVIQAMRFY